MTNDQLLPRITKAKELFDGPYNCAQSVAAANADILNKNDDEIFRLMSGFGFGKLHCLDLVGENPTSKEFQENCPLFIEQVIRELGKILSSEF